MKKRQMKAKCTKMALCLMSEQRYLLNEFTEC